MEPLPAVGSLHKPPSPLSWCDCLQSGSNDLGVPPPLCCSGGVQEGQPGGQVLPGLSLAFPVASDNPGSSVDLVLPICKIKEWGWGVGHYWLSTNLKWKQLSLKNPREAQSVTQVPSSQKVLEE